MLSLRVPVAVLCVFCGSTVAEETCRSGLQPGQRPGPYTSVVSTGQERGQSYCYICETADRPAVVVFARSLNEPLAKLVQKLDRALADPKAAELRSWVTFLHEDQPTFDGAVVKWAQDKGLRRVPLGIYEDAIGPITYRLNREADVTVLLFVKQKVVANFAYRAGELDDKGIDAVVKALPEIVK
jgi:hypothetical protein